MSKKQTKKADVQIRPLGDRVLITELVKGGETQTESGIYIPGSTKETNGAKKGVVVAVGDGRTEDGKKIPVSVKKGDTVLFSWGDAVTIDGVEYHVVSESGILAVIG